MGLIHSRERKRRDQAEAQLLRAQARHEAADASAAKWEPIVRSIESGEFAWGDLTGLQKLAMPLNYKTRCRAAERRRAASQA